MINIVIPMAGEGSRFKNVGYTTPKPFIEINGKTLIEIVLENLAVPKANYYLIARSDHLALQTSQVEYLKSKYEVTFIPIERLTEGAACTVLYGHQFINNQTPLLLANSDQFIQFDVKKYLSDCHERKLDGSILTFTEPSQDPKWSYAKIDHNGLVTSVAEKIAISDHATTGLYYYSQGKYFVDGAIDMIIRNDRVNGEFYTCPVYNYLISRGMKIGIYDIEPTQMHGLGTPMDLNIFISKKLI